MITHYVARSSLAVVDFYMYMFTVIGDLVRRYGAVWNDEMMMHAGMHVKVTQRQF